ncbi:hypothetical protein ASQ66_gp29 [Aeropyrum pernix spindle-shaped virus 1]|uniref:Uncharacterized protein n=1 Tax=Aeropyrum pernix (strain ATCC 700893 / DSM 11879 / JCM 9820 / NBRC 100138 / K1) TaxID=272557 RepID=Q9YDQ5_AERPE|nr:hypothetical protein [Aeropyrum pernix]YP_009177759.1 hypothetical protein ASQ66_gp29 [Aeropyrum pernix spindle-shaped virus 1]BAA79842.2 hypothetical protein APE_0862.1 [Aeropyrum pernix spindle-shaped virus 1] [Aeropyrum pernix K1]CCD22117.1 TPA: hypothetical protein [Aeropyrum pernix spindle-shaped virus 1]
MSVLRLTWYKVLPLYMLGAVLGYLVFSAVLSIGSGSSMFDPLWLYIVLVTAFLSPLSMLVWGFLSLTAWLLDRKLGPYAMFVPLVAGAVMGPLTLYILVRGLLVYP